VHRDHPFRAPFETPWEWFTYFFNALAARAFVVLDLRSLEAVDARRLTTVHEWLERRGLPVIDTCSIYSIIFYIKYLHKFDLCNISTATAEEGDGEEKRGQEPLFRLS
jgi:hypothetical protein